MYVTGSPEVGQLDPNQGPVTWALPVPQPALTVISSPRMPPKVCSDRTTDSWPFTFSESVRNDDAKRHIVRDSE